MLKKLLFLIVFSFLLISVVSFASDLERDITLDNYKVFKGSLKEVKNRMSELNDLTIIEIKDEKAISKCVEKVNNTKKLAKISKKLEKQLSTNRKYEKIEVLVMSKWNVNEDSFIKCIESIVKKTKYEKVKFNTVSIILSKSQIQKFAEKEEIFRIFLPEENKNMNYLAIEDKNDNIDGYTSDSTRLNPSTEMLGVKKGALYLNLVQILFYML